MMLTTIKTESIALMSIQSLGPLQTALSAFIYFLLLIYLFD